MPLTDSPLANILKGMDHSKSIEQYIKGLVARHKKPAEFFYLLFSDQKGCCAICGRKLTFMRRKRNSAQLDHDHFNDKVRAFLCYNCNIALGALKDSVLIASKLVQYLVKHKNMKRLEGLLSLVDTLTPQQMNELLETLTK